MENKFFTFLTPYLTTIDNGKFFRKPFAWLYAGIAILNLLIPIFVLVRAIDNEIFGYNGKTSFAFILIWFAVTFVSWLGFQIWWNRKNKIESISSMGDNFLAIPVFSHFIQTLGEWLGIWIGVLGFLFALFSTIILGDRGYNLSRGLELDFLQSGALAIVIMPILGYLIVVVTRFLAEQFRSLAAIANNTKKDI